MKKSYMESKKTGLFYANKQKKANWIGNNMHRSCLLKHVIGGKMEGRIEVTGR